MATRSGSSGNNATDSRFALTVYGNDTPYGIKKSKLQIWKIVCPIDKNKQKIFLFLQSLCYNKNTEKTSAKLFIMVPNIG